MDSEADKFVAIETSGSDPIRDQTTAVPNMLEKKKKVQPVGTFEYAVSNLFDIQWICYTNPLNSIPHNPDFQRCRERSQLKILWDKEKMLLTYY